MAPAVSMKLVEKLMKEYNLSRAQAVQMVNIAPINPEEMKTILDSRSSDLTDEQIIEIVDLIINKRSK
jgi:DNA-directed RNA polymerase subunit F